jgi:AcrR family transcriptional regulator
MPPHKKISKEEIVSAALRMMQKTGENTLNARSLASYIGCSTQPIFSNFSTMEELRNELLLASTKKYRSYLKREFTLQRYPEYKASGMAYIHFAREEKELFKFLFMRDRSNETVDYLEEDFTDAVSFIHKQLELTYEEATTFHMEMWAYVHGIATMLATSYLDLGDEEINNMLTDAFLGLKMRYASKKGDS